MRVTGTALVSIPPQTSGTFTPNAVCRGDSALLTVNATFGQNPPSTSVTVTANLIGVGGGAAVPMPMNDQGGNVFTLSVPVSLSAATGIVNIPVTVTDSGGRSSTTPVSLAIGDCSTDSGAPVVISMVYPAGGLAGSIFNGDFVELHNRSCGHVNVDGWSLQYTSAGGVNTFDGTRQVNLTGSIPAGGYLLVLTRRILETDPGLPFPAPDVLAFPANPLDPPVPPQSVNGFGMDNNAARLALCNSTAPIGASCASHPSVVDFVGYGSSTFCYEGVAPAADTGTLKAAMRKGNGCQDSNQGFSDFDVTFPRDPFNASSVAGVCPGVPCSPACNLADIAAVGGTTEEPGQPDNQLTVDDVIVFVNLFSDGTGCPGTAPCSRADVCGVGGPPEQPEGDLTVDDVIGFFNAFSDGC